MKMRKGLPFTKTGKNLIDIVLNEDSVAECLLAFVRPYIWSLAWFKKKLDENQTQKSVYALLFQLEHV